MLPAATIVIDRFHVARHERDAVDERRKHAVRRVPKELPKQAHSDLNHTLWPFRKRPADLDEVEPARRDGLLAPRPPLQQAYRLREPWNTLFATARAKQAGLRRSGSWRARGAKSGLRCFAAFLKRLATWLDRIANSFIDHQTSGFVQGRNTKLNVLTRRCYGLRKVVRRFQRLPLDREGYRRFRPWRTTAPRYSGVSGNS